MDQNEIQSRIRDIYSALDTPPHQDEIENAILNECQTGQDVVRFAVSCFAAHEIFLGHGTEDYWSEAVEIVQAVMRLQPPCDESTLNSRLTRRERTLIAKIMAMRIFERIPTPYLTHRAFFCGHQFYVDSRVIIPRSPIAELIDQGFPHLLGRTPARVLDMCTGSGCIAISIALRFEGSTEVDAVDISEDALDVCSINIDAYGLEDLVTPIRSDLFDSLPEGDKYDLIVANPPYVDEEELESLPEEYLKEPDIALRSGADGLDLARRILTEAGTFLNEDGILIVEVGGSEEPLVEAFPQVPFHFVEIRQGGSGVFILTSEQLKACSELLVD